MCEKSCRWYIALWALVIMCLIYAPSTFASTLRSELRVGIGVGGQHLPHYRGSEQMSTTVLPIPLIEYRGKILKSDQDGTRMEFSLAERVEFNISADLALRGDTDENRLREGMPKLASEIQLGPSINVDLTGQGFNRGIILRLPIRPAIAVGGDVDYLGYSVNPMVTWIAPKIFERWRVSLDMGGLYGSSDYHQYYYAVPRKYVTPSRPAYSVSDGFSGTFTEVGVGARAGDFLYGFNLRYDNLRDASFYSSPLVQTDDYWSFTFGVGWFFKSWTWNDDL